MVARSPTYILPFEYIGDVHGFGMYDNLPIEAADKLLLTLPTRVSGQLLHSLFFMLASKEP